MLSQAGKEIMIKSVTSAIPMYVMNCFKLPVGLIDNLNSLMAKFFWENTEGRGNCSTSLLGVPVLLQVMVCVVFDIEDYRRIMAFIQRVEWTPPQTGFVKVNCDAAWKQGSRDGATWVIIRDSRGSFMGARFKRLQWVSSSLIAEAQTLRDGLHFAWHLRVRNVELESDSKQLIHILRREQHIPSEVEVIIGDILHLTKYMEVKFQYVKRSINNAAHVVAHWDHRGVLEAEWLSTPPVWPLPAL
ncbi:hypothetical protein LIER_37103 [Lithospermum erythrorhizon]|uniref:RNase H type-1 domain-containing protein n=1 Tax=Lithospermum erythrorhizon TaxID=34254 RepID=A0AAV3PJJ7_LITER